MQEKQNQRIGNNSTGIQVQGDYITTPNYNELKEIFTDLFQLNFPKVQEIASNIANERINSLMEVLKESFENHKDVIDPAKFMDPSLQYEMQSMAINVARRGEKSNMNILTELLCNIASKDCPELIELISSEALKIVPMLGKKHLAFLGLAVLINEASLPTKDPIEINDALKMTLEYLKDSNEITQGDIQYISSTGTVQSRGISPSYFIPFLIRDLPEIKDKRPEDIKSYCEEFNLDYINNLVSLVEKCLLNKFQLMATGRLIGWLYLSKFTKIDIKQLFI